MKTIVLIAIFSGLAMPLAAQSPRNAASSSAKPAKPELSSGPLLRPVGNYSQWEVSYTYPDEQKQDKPASGKPKPGFTGAEARTRKIMTTRTGQIVHEELTDLADRKTERWFNGATQYGKGKEGTVWFELQPSVRGQQDYNPLPANGFRNLDWITPENFVGTVPYGNVTCLVFAPGGSQKLDLGDPAEQTARLKGAETVAFIDADTRMPIAVRTRDEVRTYRFNPPPTEMQTFPTDLASQIKQGDEARARLHAPAPRPY